MTQKSSFIICGNYGASNLGDEAILEGILTIIRPFSTNITVMGARPSRTAKFHHVHGVGLIPCGFRSFFRAVFTLELLKTIRAMHSADVFILGGGGLFSDESPYAIIIWFIQALCAKLFKKRIVCLGQSIGPLRFFWSRFLTKKVFKWATFISVRDEYSKKILEKFGIKHVFALSDPAFLLAGKFETSKKITNKKYIIVSLRPWSKHLQTKNIKILAQFIDWIAVKYGFTIFLLPFQNFPDNDTTVFERLKTHLKNKKVVQSLPFNEDFHTAMNVIFHAEAVIGMRLHSIIFAALAHVPFLALSYSQKVRSIAEDLGQDRFILEWNDLQLSDLKQKFATLIELRQSISQILAEKAIFMQKKALRHSEALAKL